MSAVSVEDLANFAVIGDPQSVDWNDSKSRIAEESPDGAKVAIVVRQGNPKRGTNDASLLLYRKAGLLTGARPETVAQFSSTGNHQPIAFVRWLKDSRTLLLVGTRGAELPQVHRLDLDTRQIETVTNVDVPLLWYDVTASGEQLLLLKQRPWQPPSEDENCRRYGCLITADNLFNAERGIHSRSMSLSLLDLRSGRERSFSSPEDVDPSLDFCDPKIAGGISPDGRFAIRICTPREHGIRPWWSNYGDDTMLRSCIDQGNAFCFRRGLLTDLESGKSTEWSDAPLLPARSAADPLWIDGGKYFILAGAVESLNNVVAAERRRRARALAIQQVDPQTHAVTRIARLDERVARVTSARWDPQAQTLTVESVDAARRPLSSVNYLRQGQQWVVVATSRKRTGTAQVSLAVEQTLNDPPVLVAVDKKSGSKRHVLDPNPWLADRKLARVEAIEWRVKPDLTWQGGLYYPPDYDSAARYPLVIQTHGFRAHQFSLNGSARNFAAQALAARDILVLQVAETFNGRSGTPEEWPTVQAGYEAAVDYLDAAGLIYRNRVGIQGWSRTGPHVGYTLTHSSFSFAAAAFTNTGDFGWFGYIAAGAPTAYHAMYGAAPFGDGLQAWQQLSPSFNLDRVTAPMLICGNSSVWGLWDWYAGLRRLRKPVEYWFMPEGRHDVFQVDQRIHLNQLLVDWFRYWLKDEEDTEPRKAAQYGRWRQFRGQQAVSSMETTNHSADRVATAKE